MRFTPTTVAFLALLTPSFGNVLMCYFGSWAGYRAGNGTFSPEDIDPTLCTHIIYAFIGITSEGAVKIDDPFNDLADDGGKNGFARFVALKEISPSTKVLVGIGGWNQGSLNFSAVVNNSTIRSTFVKNAVTFLEKYHFDGLDMDWEYPALRGGIACDVENFVNFLAELKEAFEEKGFILTAAVAAPEAIVSISYDIPKVSKYLDFINVMTYDLHGFPYSTVGINAPLYAGSYEKTATELQLNVNASINYWLDSGADASKIVLGMPLYGRTFTLANSSNNTPGSAASGPGTPGQYSQEAGSIGYNELCERQIDQGNWTTVWSEEQQVPYTYSGDQWVGYDNEKSIAIKTNYAIDMGLAGVMFWSVETDDFKPVCGDVKFPLIKSAHNLLFPASKDCTRNKKKIKRKPHLYQ